MAARAPYRLLLAFGLALVAAGAHAQTTPAAAEPKPEPATPAPAPEPEPTEEAERPPSKPQRNCGSLDVLSGICTEEEAAQAAAQKIWRLMARIELVMPVVFDDTPETEMLAYYYVGGELELPFLLRGLYATAWIGLIERFYRYDGQSPVDLEDPFVALGYRHSLSIGEDQQLGFVHRFGLKFPASRPSRYNMNYTALDWLSAVRYPLGDFTLGANLIANLEFHQYSTQSGDLIDADFDAAGGQNTVVRLEGAALLQYSIFDLPSAGNLLADASIGYRHRFHYDGSFEPDWYWALGATYTPISYFSVALSLEHGYSDLLRGGVPELVFFDRNETTWHIYLHGRY
ncbi:MAG TPA: hypothetical protein VJV78_05395 [Polyangiales bacterium]|nr:hypothetical protein [Polyangiales bacterium]